MNTVFRKKFQRKWTRVPPNGSINNEIDYTITIEKQIVKAVIALNKIFLGSDYRMVRVKIRMSEKLEENCSHTDKDLLALNQE